ncbi:MAG: tetratricopeptide repeat protein [Luteolibacter sp.]
MPEITEQDLPADAKPLWLKAINAVQVNNHSYAITLLQSVVEKAPGFLEGRTMLRNCAVQVVGEVKKKTLFGSGGSRKIQSTLKKNPEGAIVLAEKELAKDPGNEQINELLFEAAIKLEMVETAIFALETVRKIHPENATTLHKLAKFYLDIDRPDQAAEVYNDIIKHHPTDGIAIKGSKDASARASMQRQKWDEETDMRSLMRDQDQFADLEESSRTGLTREQLEARRDKAIEKYNQDTQNLKNTKDLAGVYEQLEDWHNAFTFYTWAHNLSAGDNTLLKKASEMNDKAIEVDLNELEAAVAADPNNEELRAALESRREDRAKEKITESQLRVDANPTDPHLRFELGSALFMSKQYSEAIPHLQQASRNPHIRTKVLLTLARCFKEKQMFDLAVKQLSDALGDLPTMDGTKKEVLYEKGLIHESMGDNDAALESYKQIYEVDYGYRDVAQRVEASYTK